MGSQNERHIHSEQTNDFISFVRDNLKWDESKAMFEKVVEKAKNGSEPTYTQNFITWLYDGSTVLLRDELCLRHKPMFAYLQSDFRQNNTWFNAFADIDTVGYKRRWWMSEERLCVKNYLTVSFLRDTSVDLETLGKHSTGEIEKRHLARLLYDEYVLKDNFDGCHISEVSAHDGTLHIEAQLAFTKGINADNVDFFEFALRRPHIERPINGSFRIHGLTVGGVDYPFEEDSETYDRDLEIYKVRMICEQEMPLLEDWTQALVSARFMNTKQIENRVDLLLATTAPVFSSVDANETAGKKRSLKEIRFEGIVNVIDPTLVATIKQKSLNKDLDADKAVAELRKLKRALSIINSPIPTAHSQAAPSIEAIASGYAPDSTSATVTPVTLATLLNEHTPDSEAGNAFRSGLLVASQLALEIQNGQGGTADIRHLHEQMLSEIEDRQTLNRKP